MVVLSFEEYQKMTSPQCDLIEFLGKSPLREVDIDFSTLRSKEVPRKVEI